MSILIDENQTQSYVISNNNSNTNQSKTDDNFAKSLEESQKQKSETFNTNIKDEIEAKKKLIEELLNKIREIVNSGINAEKKEKIDEILEKIKENLSNSSENNYSIEELENLLSQLQSLIDEQMKNFSGKILENIDMKNRLEDISSQTEDKKKETDNQKNPINNYKRVDIEEELKKFQNIKLDI